MSSLRRVLVTGSRDWDDAETMARVLAELVDQMEAVGDQVLLVHGGARGADTLAGAWAKERGLPVEVHQADWDKHGKAAGPVRNAVMVEAGAAVCVAFPRGESRGTRDCMARAEAAGIPVLTAAELASEGSTTQAASFTCPRCGRTSFHPEDARHAYCGSCHWFFARGATRSGGLP